MEAPRYQSPLAGQIAIVPEGALDLSDMRGQHTVSSLEEQKEREYEEYLRNHRRAGGFRRAKHGDADPYEGRHKAERRRAGKRARRRGKANRNKGKT